MQPLMCKYTWYSECLIKEYGLQETSFFFGELYHQHAPFKFHIIGTRVTFQLAEFQLAKLGTAFISPNFNSVRDMVRVRDRG